MRVLLTAAALLCSAGAAAADNIYVIHQNHPMSDNARNDLTQLGHNVTFATNTLQDYTAFDQVWDLRYATNMTQQDVNAMGAYLRAGGRMYISGEHGSFEDSRNISLRNLFFPGVGAGTIGNFDRNCTSETEAVLDQRVNVPNAFQSILYQCSTSYFPQNISQGFLVTGVRGSGSLIGWDFGDINGAQNARMLAGFDIEIFNGQNGVRWTENMYTYLATIPTPSSAAGLGIFALVATRRRR